VINRVCIRTFLPFMPRRRFLHGWLIVWSAHACTRVEVFAQGKAVAALLLQTSGRSRADGPRSGWGYGD